MVLDKSGSITVLNKAMKLCSPTVKMLAKIFLHADLRDSGHFCGWMKSFWTESTSQNCRLEVILIERKWDVNLQESVGR